MQSTRGMSARGLVVVLVVLVGLLAAGQPVLAHCDSLDGPVVNAARLALAERDATPVLMWVRPADEDEIRSALASTLAVREYGPEARRLADTWFFETLVRLHRAGEGAPYTGLKPAGQIDAVIHAADQALRDGGVDRLASRIGQAAQHGIRERFARVLEAAGHKDESVAAGRRYVEAYVVYVHYVEGLHESVAASGAHHAGDEVGQTRRASHTD